MERRFFNNVEEATIKGNIRTYPYILMGILGCCFYLINTASPLRCDDLMYQFFWSDKPHSELLYPIDLNNRIDSFGEAFSSQLNHYMLMNGRFTVHFIVQCFCGFLGKPLFNIINTLIYLAFLYGCLCLTGIKDMKESFVLISLLWLGLPVQYIFSFDIAFAVNYLWTATACVYFLVLFHTCSRSKDKVSHKRLAILFLYGFICGSMHEGFTLPLSGSLFFYVLLHYKQLNTAQIALILGIWTGTLTVVLAPGTLNRGSSSLSGQGLTNWFSMKLNVLYYSKRFLIAVLFFSILSIQRGRIYANRFLRKHAIIIGIIILDLLFVLAVPHYSQRMEFPLEWLSTLLIAEMLFTTQLWRKYRRHLSYILLCLTVFHAPMTVYYAQLVGREYQDMLTEYQQHPHGKTRFRDIAIPKPFMPYIQRIGEVEQSLISFTMKKEMIIEN